MYFFWFLFLRIRHFLFFIPSAPLFFLAGNYFSLLLVIFCCERSVLGKRARKPLDEVWKTFLKRIVSPAENVRTRFFLLPRYVVFRFVLSLLLSCFDASAAYSGEWHDGKYNGEGTLTLPSGERYEGEAGGAKTACCVNLDDAFFLCNLSVLFC